MYHNIASNFLSFGPLSWYSRVAVVKFIFKPLHDEDFGDGKKASQRST